MTLFSSLFTSVSGMNSQGQALSAISDNIANVNTAGFKGKRILFSSLVTGQAGGTFTPGGTQSRVISQVDKEGILQPTTSATDIAITGGSGFFVVKETSADSSTNAPLYTRAGSFQVNDQGYLVNTAGLYLQAWVLDEDGNVVGGDIGSIKPVSLTAISNPSQQTTAMDLILNLPATDAIGVTHDVETLVYDSVGVGHNLTLTWTRVAIPTTPTPPAGTAAAWELSVKSMTKTSDASNSILSGTASLTPSIITFGVDGNPNMDPDIAIDFSGITLSTGGIIGDGTTASGDVLVNNGTINTADGITMNSSDYVPRKISQNGVPYGSFSRVSISETGVIRAHFTNGNFRDMFQLPIATFNDVNSLQEKSGNTYIETNESGSALLQQPGVGGAGKIQSRAVEGSTVDIADQFSSMIITQKAYSANARVVTATNELLDELLRIV